MSRYTSPAVGLVVGAVAVLFAVFALPAAAGLPLGLIVIDAALAWGLLALARIVVGDDAPWDRLVAALAPYVVVGFLVRRTAAAAGVLLPLPLRASLLLDIAVLAAALIAFSALRSRAGAGRALVATGAAGSLLVALLVARVTLLPPLPAAGDVAILAIAISVAGAALSAQAWIARRIDGKLSALGTAPALAVAAAQLLDGTITYFSVVDPLHLASSDFTEQVALSALVLDTTGVGYVALKWIVGLVAGYALARDARKAGKPERRFGFALLLVYFGLQPAFFSGSQLL